jgi:predicted secreted protein
MTWPFAFFTFLNAWWVMIFVAVPLSIKYASGNERPPGAEEGYAAAPKVINWKKAVIIASILALAITVALALVIKSGIVPVRNSYANLYFNIYNLT